MHGAVLAPQPSGEPVARPSAPPPRLLLVALAAAGVIALAGLGLGVNAIVSSPPGDASVVREPPAPDAWRATASFGPVAAERVERSVADLLTAHHETPNARNDQVVVSVSLENRTARDMPFSPGELRLEAVGAGTTVTAIDPNPPPGSIAAGDTLRTDVAFLVDVAHRDFALVFQDALSPRRVRIALGHVPAPRETE